MKRIFSNSSPAETAGNLALAGVFGASLGLFVHGYWLADVFAVGSRSLLVFTILVGLLGMAGYSLLFGWLKRTFSIPSGVSSIPGIAGISLLAGAFLLFTLTDRWQEPARYIDVFLPTHALEITIPPGQDLNGISIRWIKTSLGDVSYDAVVYEGWSLQGDELVLTNFADNQFRWVGKTGEEVQIVFDAPVKEGGVVLSWDGHAEPLQFTRKRNTYERSFAVPFFASGYLVLLLGILNFALWCVPVCGLVWMKRVEMLQSIRWGGSPGVQRIGGREWVVLLAVMALSFGLRALYLENLFPGVEEYSHINAAKQILRGVPVEDVYQRSMFVVTLPVSLMFRLFGNELWAARLLGVMFNVFAVIPLYLVARKINRPVAVLSILLYATSPWVISISRIVREYAYYPFYYFWIILVMTLLLEQFPDRFRVNEDWRIILKPGTLIPGLLLLLPPIYAIYVDVLSTFKLILIAYVAMAVVILLKMDLRSRWNIALLLVASGFFFTGVYLLIARFPLFLAVNPSPLGYFFLNSAQQWYYDRFSVIPLAGLLGAAAAGVLLRRVNSIPLFMTMLYGGFLGFFLFSSNRFFAPRHLSSTQLWYIVLTAIGLYLVWSFLKTFSFLHSKRNQALAAVILAGLTLNFQQSIAPIMSYGPYMPVSQEYHSDLTELQYYMLDNVRDGDVLISSKVYSRYVFWVEEPVFRRVFSFNLNSTEEDVLAIMDEYDSGWIVIDELRTGQMSFSVTDVFAGINGLEYAGQFGDQYVWRWSSQPEGGALSPRIATYAR